MTALRTLMVMSVAALVAGGCVTSNLETKESVELVGTAWLAEAIGGDTVAVGVADGATSTLGFVEPGQVAGRGGCNRYFGDVTIDGQSIEVRQAWFDHDGVSAARHGAGETLHGGARRGQAFRAQGWNAHALRRRRGSAHPLHAVAIGAGIAGRSPARPFGAGWATAGQRARLAASSAKFRQHPQTFLGHDSHRNHV